MGRKARERAQQKAASTQPGRQAPFLEPEQVKDLYDRGLAVVFERMATAEDSGRANEWLRQLAMFRARHVIWAASGHQGMIRTMEGGEHVLAYLVARSARDPHIGQQRYILEVDWQPGFSGRLLRLNIKPVPISERLAGLLAVHELEHLESMAMGREVYPARRQPYIEGEVRAYSVELAAAELLSEGRYCAAVEQELERNRLGTWAEVAALYGGPNLEPICARLDRAVLDAALSSDERALLHGFHLFALAFILIDRSTVAEEEGLAEKAHFVEALYDPLGVLPPA